MSSQEQLDQDEVVVEVFPGIEFTNAREARGLELNEVATTLNISASYLIAIEEGRLNALPNRVFAIGYLKGYARHLGLDEEQVVADYERFTGGGGSSTTAKPLKTVSGSFDAPKRKGGGMLAFTTVVLLGIVAGAGYWWQGQQEVVSDADTSAAALPTTGEPVSLSVLVQGKHSEAVTEESDASQGTVAESVISGAIEDQVSGVEEQELVEVKAEPQSGDAVAAEDVAANTEDLPTVVADSTTQVVDAEPEAGAQVEILDSQASDASAQVLESDSAPESQPVVPVSESDSTSGVTTSTDAENAAEVSVLAAGEGHLRIVFSADCWVEVRDGNGKMLVASVRNAQRGVDIKGAYPFSVTLGALSSVESLSYNGDDVELVKRGRSNVLRMTLPQAE